MEYFMYSELPVASCLPGFSQVFSGPELLTHILPLSVLSRFLL